MLENRIYMDDEYFLKCIDRAAFISEGTKKSYMFVLRMFQNDVEKWTRKHPTLNDVVYNPETYKGMIAKYDSLHTQKSIVTAVLSVLKHTGIKRKNKKLFSRWYEIFKPITRQLREHERNHVASERQRSAIISWDDILRVRDNLTYGSDEHLLLSMYTIVPPRRQLDYYQIRVYSDPAEKPDRAQTHVHLAGAKGPYILVTRFKTDKFYRPFYNKLPDELVKIIKQNLDNNPREYLFVGAKNRPFTTANGFTKYSNNILKRLFNNKYMTVNILRHASATYINQKPDVTFGERERHAYQMGHSINKQLSYEIKQVEKKMPDIHVDECYKTNAAGNLKVIPCITLDSTTQKLSKKKEKLIMTAKLLAKQIDMMRKASAPTNDATVSSVR
jgi:hypothetical protein